MNTIDQSAPVNGTGLEQPPATPTTAKPIKLADLPDTTFPGDPEAAAMAMIAKFSRNSKALSQELRKAAQAQRKAAQSKEIKALRDKADDMRSAGVFQAAVLAGSAAMQGASFGCQLSAYNQAKLSQKAGDAAAHATDDAARAGLEQTAETARDNAKLYDLYAGGLSRASETAAGLGKVFDKFDEATETDHDADATQARHEAENAKDAADEHADDAKEAEELAQKAFDAIRAVFQAKHSAELAIINRLA